MPRSAESFSLDDHPAYTEKDSSVTQKDIDADNLPTLGAQPTMAKPDGPVITSKSKGVIGMELLASRLNTKYFILLYGGFILLAYTLSLGKFRFSRAERFVDKAVHQINTPPVPTTHTQHPRPSKHIPCSQPSV